MTVPRIFVVGSVNIDMVVAAPRFVAPGETLGASSLALLPGGKGANQAAAAARMGVTTGLLGRVGADPFAGLLRAALGDAGVDLALLGTVDGSSGAALITTVPNGNNAILVVAGANAALQPEQIDEAWPQLAKASIVLTQLEIPLETVEHLARRCYEAAVPLMLDPAPVRPLEAALLRGLAWLTPNEAETQGLTGVDVSAVGEAGLREVALQLLATGPEGVVLKLGARGAYVATAAEQRWIEPFAVPARDTTAAGDVFNGAFAAALVCGGQAGSLSAAGDVFAAARVACAAAALSTRRAGAIPSLPTRAEVATFLSTR